MCANRNVGFGELVNWEISIFMYITELPQISTQFSVFGYVCVSGVLKAD